MIGKAEMFYSFLMQIWLQKPYSLAMRTESRFRPQSLYLSNAGWNLICDWLNWLQFYFKDCGGFVIIAFGWLFFEGNKFVICLWIGSKIAVILSFYGEQLFIGYTHFLYCSTLNNEDLPILRNWN